MQKIFPQGNHSKLLLSDLYVFLGVPKTFPIESQKNMVQHGPSSTTHLLGMFVLQSDRYHLPRPRNSQCYKQENTRSNKSQTSIWEPAVSLHFVCNIFIQAETDLIASWEAATAKNEEVSLGNDISPLKILWKNKPQPVWRMDGWNFSWTCNPWNPWLSLYETNPNNALLRRNPSKLPYICMKFDPSEMGNFMIPVGAWCPAKHFENPHVLHVSRLLDFRTYEL